MMVEMVIELLGFLVVDEGYVCFGDEVKNKWWSGERV